MAKLPERKRQRVFERDGHLCVASSTARCAGVLTIQHRANKQMGGSKLLDGYENLLTMCAHHNDLLERDAEFAQIGRVNGWKLSGDARRIGAATVPVLYSDGELYQLDIDGDRKPYNVPF